MSRKLESDAQADGDLSMNEKKAERSASNKTHFVCVSCYHEQRSFTICEKCQSRRLEHIEFKKQQLGEHWREIIRVEVGPIN
jgi:hypothetical protein